MSCLIMRAGTMFILFVINTGYIISRASNKIKMWPSCSKIIKNFKMMTAEYEAK